MSVNGNIPEAVSAHLRACEEALLNPAVRRDRAQVAALLSEDFHEFGASGRVWTRQQVLDLLATEAFLPPVIEDFACSQIAQGVVLATYRTARTDPRTNEHTATLRSSLWREESGKWRLRFHQGTRAY